MRLALIENSVVLNVIEGEMEKYPSAVPTVSANIGDSFDGATFSPPPPPPRSAEQIKQAMITAVQAHLDAAAKAKGYDNIVSACSYAATPNPYQAEGAAFIAWRGAVWQHCYGVLAQVEAGTRPVPTAPDLIAELPVMTWPN